MDLLRLVSRLPEWSAQHLRFFEKGRLVTKSFPEIHDDVKAAADRLRSWGVKAGMRVGILASNCYPWIVYDLALIELRAVSVAFTDDFASTSLDELRTRYSLGLILISKKEDKNPVGPRSCVAYLDAENPPDVRAAEAAGEAADADAEMQALIFSSGTSGRVKGLIVGREGVQSTITAFARRLDFRHGDCLLIFLPLSNFQQRLMYYAAFWSGFDVILTDPARLFRALKELRPTLFVGPPIVYETVETRILNLPPWKRTALLAAGGLLSRIPSPDLRRRLARTLFHDVHEAFGGRMRFMLTGMAPTKRSTLELFARMDLPLFEGYGLNECGPIAFNVPGMNRLGSVGRPVDGAAITIADDGEIIVQKEHPQCIGYFESPPGEAESTFLGDNRIATGDMGRFDEDGFLYLLGRKKEIIVTPGGMKVHPEVFESEINASSDVASSVIFGGGNLPHLVAVVSLRQPAAPSARERIEQFIDEVNKRHPASVRVERIVFTDVAFTRENGLLRPNLKLDRKRIGERFLEEIQGN